jgi:S1-C subfamily serine protease
MVINVMFRKPLSTTVTLSAVALVWFASTVTAQTPAQKKSPRSVTSSASNQARSTLPQVVTIVHRLNGLKMFRMFSRSEGRVEAIASFDEEFNLLDDVHTNIIAGLALDDGKTIVAWLPEVELEFGPTVFRAVPRAPRTRPGQKSSTPNVVSTWPSAFPFRGAMFGSPDLTVIGSNGKRVEAEYVGLDGATGLSILRVKDPNLADDGQSVSETISVGESVRVLGPERAAKAPALSGSGLYVRIGTTNGTVLAVKHAPAGGGVSRFKVRSARLTQANIGGVAVNEAGETIGIVDGLEGTDATVLPTSLVRRAASRVLTQQASVPRPWLGVKGEPVSQFNMEQFRSLGWKRERATTLVERHRGILLTSITAGSPAALAALRAGDVILKVNNAEVENGDDFSWMLEQAGPSASVTFTLARPDKLFEEAVNVELSGHFNAGFNFEFPGSASTSPLLSQGIETVALKPAVASKLGATSGLLVVYVDPATAAFSGGLQPGDVIEAIDGKPPSNDKLTLSSLTPDKTSVFEIVRKKQKLEIEIKIVRQEKKD